MSPDYPTGTEAAHAWAKHRGLDLDILRDVPLGTVALYLAERSVGGALPIPMYVIRTLANLERENADQRRVQEPWPEETPADD